MINSIVAASFLILLPFGLYSSPEAYYYIGKAFIFQLTYLLIDADINLVEYYLESYYLEPVMGPFLKSKLPYKIHWIINDVIVGKERFLVFQNHLKIIAPFFKNKPK